VDQPFQVAHRVLVLALQKVRVHSHRDRNIGVAEVR
jgi:hypothetical protein